MDRHIIENQHIVARYLAGQLDAAESAAFESYFEKNPDTVRDIERTLRLKEGLAVLQDRGELSSIMQARKPPVWRPAIGLAAGIAALVVGVWLWVGQSSVAPIVGTVAALVDGQGHPLRVASTHMLVKVRGLATSLDIPLPAERSAIELQMIPSSRAADASFRVVLGQVDAANAVATIAETRAVANASDGYVHAFLDSAKLSRGRYVIDLQQEGRAAADSSADRFVIEIR